MTLSVSNEHPDIMQSGLSAAEGTPKGSFSTQASDEGSGESTRFGAFVALCREPALP